MLFSRGERPKIEEVVEQLKDQNCEIKTYEMNIIGPYGGLTEVVCLVNKTTFEQVPYYFSEGEKVTTHMLEHLERKLDVKLVESNVVSIKRKT